MDAYRRHFLLIIGLIILHLSGCAAWKKYGKLEKSARNKYHHGQYDAAVYDCAASLRLNPKYDKAQRLIQDAFKAAVNTHQSQIKQLKASGDPFKWDAIVAEYEALIDLNDTVRNLPVLYDKDSKGVIHFATVDYTDELAEARVKAAESHYEEGQRLAKDNDIEHQKMAAKQFKLAQRYVPGYKDAADRYERSRQAGITRMAIVPFEDKSGKKGRYGAISERIVDEVISDVMSDPSVTEFLEIVSRDQLQHVMKEQKLGLTGLINERTAVQLGRILGVHEILTGKITQIVYTPARTTSSKEKEKARVVIRKEKYKDDEGKEREKKIYGDVHATVRRYTRTTSASITASYNIIDVETARINYSQSFTGKANFKAEWATYSGDSRAVNRSDMRLVKRGEQLAPVEEEIVSTAVEDLSGQLAASVKNYAR